MQRILHIIGGMDRAGAETMIMNLYRNIDRTKFQFDFLYFMDKKCDYDDEIIALGGKIHRIIASNSITRNIKVYQFLKANPIYTIVHAHTLFNIGPNLLVAKLAGVNKRIAHSHNTSDNAIKNKVVKNIYQFFARTLIQKYSTFNIACGVEASEFLFDNKEIMILYNGIDVDEYGRIAKKNTNYIRENFNINPSSKILIQVGRLNEVKNHLFSLQLMKKLKDEQVDFKFLIIGQGPLEAELNNQVKILELENEVIFTGIRDDVPQLMASADLMVMPSLFEGFPVVLVESQAMGLRTLVSNNVSEEVDVVGDLIEFLSLDDSDKWMCNCLEYFKMEKNTSDYSTILKQKGFDAKLNAKRLCEIYVKQL